MKKIIFGLLLLMLGVFGVVYWQWNKPRETAKDRKTEVILTVDSLFSEFQRNDSLAFATYQNKVIQISGQLKQVGLEGDGNNPSAFALIPSQTEGVDAKFRFADTINLHQLKKQINQKVILKGFFAGFNFDAMMPEMGGTFEFNQSAIIQK